MNTSISQEQLYDMSYTLIKKKANSNSFIQGISGIAGFPTTIAVDGIVIFSHYAPMINEIRALYGYAPFTSNALSPILKSIGKEILFDITVDKFLGQVPVAGIYFNAICAKALTWRLGMLFTIVSSRDEEINCESLSKVVKLIRNLTPQSDIFKFEKPDYNMFKKLVLSVCDDDFITYDRKIEQAMNAFD